MGHSPPRPWGGPCGPTHPSSTCTSPSRRDRIARIGLGVILNLAKERDVPPLAQSVSGILEHMFKHTEETCSQLISDGGLDAILYWCRWTDPVVLRHCAMALANCAMHGGQANQRLMIEKRTAEWLFPLVFSRDDELIRLHACLAITVLATNKEIEKEVERSGTLALVEPFIASLDPERFACRMLGSSDSSQGRTAEDLQRLVPLLDSSRLEAQCIAAFYLCAEAAIKTRQKQTKVKGEVGPGEGGANRERCCRCIPMWFVPPSAHPARGRGSEVMLLPSVSPDFQRDRGHAEPEAGGVLLHQQHHLLPGQKGAAHDRGGGSSAHPAHSAQLEALRGADVAAADRIQQILPELPGRAA